MDADKHSGTEVTTPEGEVAQAPPHVEPAAPVFEPGGAAEAPAEAGASPINRAPASRDELEAIRHRLEQEGRLSPAAKDVLEKALASEEEKLAPEEVEAEELADQVIKRLAELNQDLSLLVDVFGTLDRERMAELMKQLRYPAELVPFLEFQEGAS